MATSFQLECQEVPGSSEDRGELVQSSRCDSAVAVATEGCPVLLDLPIFDRNWKSGFLCAISQFAKFGFKGKQTNKPNQNQKHTSIPIFIASLFTIAKR